MSHVPAYCCKRHTPPFPSRLLSELRSNWRAQLANAARSGLGLGFFVLAVIVQAQYKG
jgi:hypothetical protein